MAFLMVTQPLGSTPDLPVFYNVEGAVGAPPAQNKREDVMLVQFFFNQVSKKPPATMDPATVEAAKAVQPTGSVDPTTINAIKVLQTEVKKKFFPGQIVDGRVSPAKAEIIYGGGMWTIALLNHQVQGAHVEIWPRIDQISGCPNELQEMVIRTVRGT